MNKDQKKNYIEEMSSKFENSKAVMVTHYQGLTMTQLDDLRAKMREHGIVFKITKNRITKLALEKTKCKDLTNLFTGPQRLLLVKIQLCQQGFSQNLQKITKI
jgi:large subunit ribosomal protein L10